MNRQTYPLELWCFYRYKIIMSDWKLDFYGNDASAEWVDELLEKHDLSLIQSTLQHAIAQRVGYLEGHDGERVLASVDILLRLKKFCQYSDDSTEVVDDWVAEHPLTVEKSICLLGADAIDRILTPQSELLELWEESEDFQRWKAALISMKELLLK